MKYKLIAPTIQGYSAVEQILVNRGILHSDIKKYLNSLLALPLFLVFH